ncbi:hypothetical protein LP420_10745 [Massilia sp. B-10]|nr:hypothetical protein LP420_10745 [Massilia sp. B-10]
MVDPKDLLSQWGIAYFQNLPKKADRSLTAMLAAAPRPQVFWPARSKASSRAAACTPSATSSKLDDKKIMPVRDALKSSTNLVFVRLMRDVVRYYMFQLPGSSAALLADADDPRRAEYLARFADREGREFMGRFYNKYRNKNAAEAEKVLLASLRPTPVRLATVHRTILPNATVKEFGDFINDNLESKNEVPEDRIARMYEQYSLSQYVAGRPRLPGHHPPARTVAGRLPARPRKRQVRRCRRRQRQGTPGSLCLAVQHAPQACPGPPHHLACWRWKPSSRSMRNGSAWATPSIRWCLRMRPRWARRPTVPPRWPR